MCSGFTAVPIVQQRLLAFGGFFMYLTLTQYLKYNARFFLLIGTLRRGLPNIFRYVDCCTLPSVRVSDRDCLALCCVLLAYEARVACKMR